ncbi:2Fe-2S ferredoxin, partial [Thalassospira profundimaris]
SCSTCHVYIDESWVEKLPPASDMEQEMLEFASAPDARLSRLSCQIRITDAMDGLVVTMPETQAEI